MIYLFCIVGAIILVFIVSMIIYIVKLKAKPKEEPDCIRHLKTRQSCDGKNNMIEFVLNDCASCPFWRGKC